MGDLLATDIMPGIESVFSSGLNDGKQVLAGLGIPLSTEIGATAPLAGTSQGASGVNVASTMKDINTRPGFLKTVIADVEAVVAAPTNPHNWPLILVLGGLYVGILLFFFKKDLLKPILKGVPRV